MGKKKKAAAPPEVPAAPQIAYRTLQQTFETASAALDEVENILDSEGKSVSIEIVSTETGYQVTHSIR